MNILLTGATGFVGKRAIDILGDVHNIVCIGRTNPNNTKVEFVEGDITDGYLLKKIAARYAEGFFDAIVHLAAYVPRTKDADVLSDAHAVNIQGTVNIIDSFDGKFKKLIVGSSAEVYDLSDLHGLITESSAVSPLSYYGATKVGGEYISLAYGKKNNIPVAIMRFSVMYGANDPIARALPNFIRRAVADEPIDVYGGDTLRDYIHVDDVVASIECALNNSFGSEVLNIGTGRGVSIRSAAEDIVRQSQSKSEIINHEGSGLDVVLDITRAKNVIGFQPSIFFPDKLSDMIESFR